MSSFFVNVKKKEVVEEVLPVAKVESNRFIPIRKKKKLVDDDILSLVKDYIDDDNAFQEPIPIKKEPISIRPKPVIKNTYTEAPSSITSVQFSFMSEDEVKDHAVIRITKSCLGGPNSLYDLRLGPLNNHETCETCRAEWKVCPGHFGYISLAIKIPHPLRSKVILDFLHLFCSNDDCNRLVISNQKIKLLGIDKYNGDSRYNKIIKEVKNAKVCPHCLQVLPKYSCEEDKYYSTFKEKKYFLSYDQIENIFSNIPEQDIDFIGLNSEFVHPTRFLISNLPVLPPCARMIVRGDEQVQHDDLTCKYQEILKANEAIEKFQNEQQTEHVPQDMVDTLVFHIKTLMDNTKGKAKSSTQKRSIKCIKKRHWGKSGRIRGNIQGKRVDFCARTVITPEAMGMLDEVVIPEHIAKVITYPVRVNDYNFKQCQKLLDDGKVRKIRRGEMMYDADIACFTRGFELGDTDVVWRNGQRITPMSYQSSNNKKLVLLPTDLVYRNGVLIENTTPPKRKDFALQIGDVIDRQLQDGDWTIFNRQPTLWKGSMRAKKVKIRPGLTFRFSLASTQAFNADFDGDEMNCFFAQSEETRVECMTILSVSENFTSGQDSKPLVSIKQDGMTGGYKLTYGDVKIDKEQFYDCLTTEYFEMDYIMNKRDHIINVLKWKGLYTPDEYLQERLESNKQKLKDIMLQHNSIDKTTKEGREDREKLKHLFNITKEYIKVIKQDIEDKLLTDHFFIGRILFSFLLPNDFEYYCDNKMAPDKKPVIITRGVMLSGTLSKAAIGSSSGSLIHHIYKDYGPEAATKFVSYYEQLINSWFPNQGFSVGLEDCIPTNTDLIETEIEKCFAESTAIYQHEKHPVLLEMKVSGVLNKASGIGQKIAAQSLRPNNNMVVMIRSGAKGNDFNIAQVTGVVGQQNVSGKRILKNCAGRSLPHFKRSSWLTDVPDTLESEDRARELFKSRGFVYNSYFKGLDPIEYFFHAAGGREGLIDTACKTADTGYMQRRITKVIDDLKIDYTGVVSNARNTVVQFNYGSDNLDASRLINTKCGLSFIDIAHTVERLNQGFLFESKLKTDTL